MKLRWSDSEEIAMRLREAMPEVDPLGVRFTDLHKWACGLAGFADDPAASNEKKLEAIQMAWYEAWREDESADSSS